MIFKFTLKKTNKANSKSNDKLKRFTNDSFKMPNIKEETKSSHDSSDENSPRMNDNIDSNKSPIK